MASGAGFGLALTTGVAAIVGGVAAWKFKKEYKKLEDSKQKDLSEVVHLIRIEDIGNLLDSDNLEVQQAAEKFLKQRASSKQYLPAILKCCLNNDKDIVLKATTSILLLCKSSNENKAILFRESALDILMKVIKNLSQDYQYKLLVSKCKQDVVVEKTFYCCVGSIFHLTLNDPSVTQALYQEKSCIRDIFLHILSDHGFHILTDVKRWSTYIIHQLVQSEGGEIKKSLRKWGIVTKATLCLIRTLGDLLLTQLCLQILVQYLNDAVDEIVHVCQEMAALGLLPHLVGLLRCEEEENVVTLAAIIIHHFCCFDIDVRNLGKIPGIVKILFTVLNSNEASVQKTILRIFNYLCISSSSFQKKLLNDIPLLKRLSVCLASGNREVVQGSLMLLHDLAMPGKHAAQKLILGNADILKSLVTLALSSSGEQAQLIAETLGFFCSCESLHSVLLKQGVVNAILHFTKSSDTSVQFWASALLLNLSMISDEIKEAIVRNGGMYILLEMAVSGDEVEMPDIASNATKAMVILGFLDATIDVKLSSGMDGSIIIDGTEYCPGKQGINIVSLDFINFKYSKGLVLQQQKFEQYLRDNHIETLKKWDPVFVVTQGDCTLKTQNDENVPEIYSQIVPKEDINKYLESPVWSLLISAKGTKVELGTDNLFLQYKLPLEECISYVLKDNFTDPLIDVLLSYPPSSNMNKSEDLELIEILARHSFQRKAIITTAGFLEYLNEMVWAVISLKIENIQDPENAVKLSHCIAALKILHACSIDKSSVSELVSRGVPRVVLCLLVSLTKFIRSTQSRRRVFNFNREDSIVESEEKQSHQHDNEVEEKLTDLNDVNTQTNTGNLHLDQFTESNDNIFYEEDEVAMNIVTERQQKDETPHTTRRRADSYIVRVDTRSRQRSESRQSFMDRSISIEQQNQSEELSVVTSPFTPTRRGLHVEEAANHQQMRRISRSMSISLQLSKSAVGEESSEILPGTDEVIKKLAKHSIMTIFHILQNADQETLEKIYSMHFIIVLYNVLSCFDESFKFQLGIPISSAIVNFGRFQNKTDDSHKVDSTFVKHIGPPHSLVLSTNKLQVSNENWYFESVRSNQPVSTSLYTEETVSGWYFEVTIHTKGIMQIGWANENCAFNPHKGIGVGDTNNSCAFDGTRCKVWSGPSIDVLVENDYGLSWQIGDVVSVLLSWQGVISFWLNGKDLGPALTNVDTSKLWYPAVSLSVDQQCSFTFNKADMRFKKKNDFVAIADVYEKFKSTSTVNNSENLQPTDLIKEVQLIGSGPRKEPVYFFEVDITSIDDISTITIGYLHKESGKDIVKTMDMSFVNSIRNDGVLGCGIVLPNKHLIITKGTEVIWESPLTEFIGEKIFLDEMFLDLVPYVSIENVIVNVGQKCFVYEASNTNKSKQKFLSLILDLMDKEDN